MLFRSIAQSIALEAAKAAKHVLFTTIAPPITKSTIPSINELNDEIKKLGVGDGRYVTKHLRIPSHQHSPIPIAHHTDKSHHRQCCIPCPFHRPARQQAHSYNALLTHSSHLLNVSLLLANWNNPLHPQTYSLISTHIIHHIAFNEHEWDKMENHSLYALSLQTHNVLPCEISTDGAADVRMAVTVMPRGKYRPYLAEKSAGFVKLQGLIKAVRVELDFRCAQNMAKDDVFNPSQSIKTNNAKSIIGIGHPPSAISQAFQKLSTALRGIPDLNIPGAGAAPPNKNAYTPGHSQLNHSSINTFRPSRVIAESYVSSLTENVEMSRLRLWEDEMPMGSDGICRPLTIHGVWRLELRRPMEKPVQAFNTNNATVAYPLRRSRGRVTGEVFEPVVKPSTCKRTHSAALRAAEDEDDVLVFDSSPEPSTSKRARSAASSAAENGGENKDGDKDEDDVPMIQRRQRLRRGEIILREGVLRERQVRVDERPSRAGRGLDPKYVKSRMGGEKGPGRGRGRRKGKGRK